MNNAAPPDLITEHRIQILMRVLSTSGTLAGLCLTGLGVVHLIAKSERVSSVVDVVLAVDSLIFIGATVTCFVALRFRHAPWIPTFANMVELLFLAGLVGMLPFGVMILYVVL
ncbi:MAG TPA: hypothetical protein VLQ46_13140 [Casimicrobiaceae bacterium]|nr:hypothetical protein [Casimicrobiaceae bacterium]